MSTTAWSGGGPGEWKRVVSRSQLIELGLTVELLDRIGFEIGDPKSARRTGRGADHGVGIMLPPGEDLRLVFGCVLEAVRRERPLVDRIARKNWNTAAYIVDRSDRRAGLRLRAHIIFPPSSRKR